MTKLLDEIHPGEVLLLDKTLSELTQVEVSVLTRVADGKQLSVHSTKLQVIDFACDFEIVTSRGAKGGHYHKG